MLDEARLDLMEHFITADKLRPGAAASKAAAILRIAEPEWYAAKRAFVRGAQGSGRAGGVQTAGGGSCGGLARNIMSILTQAMIFEKYGPRLGVEQLAELMTLSPKTIYNQVSAKTFPVKTYVDGGARWADFRDAAAHFDTLREKAG